MNFIYFGTPSFSAELLEKIIAAGFVPRAVVTNPDRSVGRKQILTPPPVKKLISSHGDLDIPILQPEKLDDAFIQKLNSYMPDFFVVFAYGKILRKNILDIPQLGTIGIHPSLLPKYRGASPFQTALLNGESATGVTLYLLDPGVDSGPILAVSDRIAITGDDTFISLARKLVNAGAELFIKNAQDFYDGTLPPRAQDESEATVTRKFKTEDGFVEPTDLAKAEAGDDIAVALDRKIRALNPEPGVWTMRDGTRIKLLEAKLDGTKLRITKIQEEGQKPKMV